MAEPQIWLKLRQIWKNIGEEVVHKCRKPNQRYPLGVRGNAGLCEKPPLHRVTKLRYNEETDAAISQSGRDCHSREWSILLGSQQVKQNSLIAHKKCSWGWFQLWLILSKLYYGKGGQYNHFPTLSTFIFSLLSRFWIFILVYGDFPAGGCDLNSTALFLLVLVICTNFL
jgi:hypothetical protein